MKPRRAARRAAGAVGAAPARRIGVLGGTFDPPHVGHLALAEWAREALALDQVLFVPAGQPPHKQRGARSSVRHRLAMTRLAVRGHRGFAVSALETRRGGPSYTADTLRTLAARHPRAEFWLLMGADMYATFDTWARPGEIATRARLGVAIRPGTRRPRRSRAAARGLGERWLDNPPLEVSSSLLRARARAGRSVRVLVPDAVARYIGAHGLYRRAG